MTAISREQCGKDGEKAYYPIKISRRKGNYIFKKYKMGKENFFMKLMFASDIHGAAECCEKMLEAFRREGADKLILLGDLLYHTRGTICRRTMLPKG